jgi:hypothetical protein
VSYLFRISKRIVASWCAPVVLLSIAACSTDMPTQALMETSSSSVRYTIPSVSGRGKIKPISVPLSAAAEPVTTSGTILWHDAFDAPDAGISNYATMQGGFLHADPLAGELGTGALRMDWPQSTTCADDWTGLDHAIAGAPTEIYIQFSVKYQPGFQFDWRNAAPSSCTGNAKKLFLVWSGDNRSRFIYVSEDHDLRAASDYEDALGTNRSQNGASPISLEQYADGNWHRVTFHIKQSSSITATDGFLYGWIDGVQRWSRPQWASGSVGGWVEFKMPSTFNQGSPANQSEWVDNLTIWRP